MVLIHLGCMKCGQGGGRGPKIPKFCWRHVWMTPRDKGGVPREDFVDVIYRCLPVYHDLPKILILWARIMRLCGLVPISGWTDRRWSPRLRKWSLCIYYSINQSIAVSSMSRSIGFKAKREKPTESKEWQQQMTLRATDSKARTQDANKQASRTRKP